MRPLRLIVALASCLLAGTASAQEICDLSDRLDLDPAGTQTPVEAAFGGGMVFLVANGLLTVVDEATLEVRAMLDLPAGSPRGAVWRDGYVYISSTGNRLWTIDAVDPNQPAMVSDLPLDPGRVLSVTAGLVHVRDGGVSTFDVSDPAAPVLAGFADADISRTFEAASSGDAVFVAALTSGLLIFDASDLAGVYLRQAFIAPSDPGSGSLFSAIQSVSVVGSRAFIGFRFQPEIWSLDVSRPFVPVRTGVFEVANDALRLQTSPGMLFAAVGSGVTAFSIAEPDSPTPVASIPELSGRWFWSDGSLLVGEITGDQTGVYGIGRCDEPCPADLAAPFGELNFFDALAFLNAFAAQDASADLAEPFGAWDFFDITAYLAAFNAGCPE